MPGDIRTQVMEKKKDLAIVLRSVRFEERHQIVTALTETHGRMSAMARNAVASRRFGGTLSPGVASLWHFVEKPGSDLARLEETEIRREFAGIRKHIGKVTAMGWICELVLQFAPEREPQPELFKLLGQSLAWLDETPDAAFEAKFAAFLNLFLGKLLQLSGTHPRLAACDGCGEPVRDSALTYQGVPERAVLVCSDCRPGARDPMPARVILGQLQGLGQPLRQALEADINPIGDGSRTLFHFLEGVLVHHVPGFELEKLKSRGMLLEALEMVAPEKPDH